jgi:putative addiction module component (TIGR02574 family)
MERVDLSLSDYSYEQKLDLLETLWDDLARNDIVLKSPDWHQEILKDREQALSSGRVKISDWEEAKERIRRNVSCG